MLHIERQALLRAVGPDKVRREAVHGVVVGTRGVDGRGALDFDDARTEVGELARGERPRNDLLERDDGDAFERPHVNSIVSPGNAAPLICVLQRSPAATGWASVMTPVVTISPAASGRPCCFSRTPTRCSSAAMGLPSTFSPTPRSTKRPSRKSSTSTRASTDRASGGRGAGAPTIRRPCRPWLAVESGSVSIQA